MLLVQKRWLSFNYIPFPSAITLLKIVNSRTVKIYIRLINVQTSLYVPIPNKVQCLHNRPYGLMMIKPSDNDTACKEYMDGYGVETKRPDNKVSSN